MKKGRSTEERIIGILKQHEAAVKAADLCRERGISAASSRGELLTRRNNGQPRLTVQSMPT